MNFYMHTLDGHPAAFDGDQICHWWSKAKMATSLRQIRREQHASISYRRKLGWSVPRYEYILVHIEEASND